MSSTLSWVFYDLGHDMVIIEINNSYSQIKGLKTDQFRQIKKLLSYTPGPSEVYFSGGFARPKYLIDSKGFFPTGLLNKVKVFLGSNGIPLNFIDLRWRPKGNSNRFEINLGNKIPYETQIKASIMASLYPRCGIVMPTGTGKSLVIALIIKKLGLRTIVVVPTLEIKKQLTETLIEILGKTEDILVENIDSKALVKTIEYDCLIIDECHHSAASTYQKLNKTAWKSIYHRIFLTATYFRNQQDEQLLFTGIAGEVNYTLSYKEAVSKGYICPVEAYYVQLPKTIVSSNIWNEVYKELVVNNINRNLIIADMMQKLVSEDISVLCLVKEVAHGHALAQLTGIDFVNGQDEESRSHVARFNKGEIKGLIGTSGVIGEGVDTKPAEYIIIAGLGKAKSAFQQQIGRGVRKYGNKDSCKIILFNDLSHRWMKSHFKTQCKILKEEYDVVPIKL